MDRIIVVGALGVGLYYLFSGQLDDILGAAKQAVTGVSNIVEETVETVENVTHGALDFTKDVLDVPKDILDF
jgi:hypothetical protein